MPSFSPEDASTKRRQRVSEIINGTYEKEGEGGRKRENERRVDRGTTEGHLETDGANLLGKLMHRTCYIRERLLALPTTHPPPSLYSLLTPLHYCVLVYLPVGFIMGNVPYAGAEWLVLEPRKCCDEESWGRDGVVR